MTVHFTYLLFFLQWYVFYLTFGSNEDICHQKVCKIWHKSQGARALLNRQHDLKRGALPGSAGYFDMTPHGFYLGFDQIQAQTLAAYVVMEALIQAEYFARRFTEVDTQSVV